MTRMESILRIINKVRAEHPEVPAKAQWWFTKLHYYEPTGLDKPKLRTTGAAISIGYTWLGQGKHNPIRIQRARTIGQAWAKLAEKYGVDYAH